MRAGDAPGRADRADQIARGEPVADLHLDLSRWQYIVTRP